MPNVTFLGSKITNLIPGLVICVSENAVTPAYFKFIQVSDLLVLKKCTRGRNLPFFIRFTVKDGNTL